MLVVKRLVKRTLQKVVGVRGTSHLTFLLKYPAYYWALRGYIDINGWLGYKEAIYLYKAANSITQAGPTIVEIGTWQGKSAVVFGQAVKKRSNAKVICIDPFNASGDLKSQPDYQSIENSMVMSLKEACFQNLKRNGVEDVVELIEGRSDEVARSWNKPIDLLFIDGDHEYAAVKRDLHDWSPFLAKGGLLVMDDVSMANLGHEGPTRVVRESILDNPEWSDCFQIGTIHTARKRWRD